MKFLNDLFITTEKYEKLSILSEALARASSLFTLNSFILVPLFYAEMVRHYKRKRNEPLPTEEALQLAVTLI